MQTLATDGIPSPEEDSRPYYAFKPLLGTTEEFFVSLNTAACPGIGHNPIQHATTPQEWLMEFAFPRICLEEVVNFQRPADSHPGVRLTALERAMWWFGDGGRERLFWVCGPAGVGKSAIVQDLAITAACAGRLGGAVFIPNIRDRNSSRRILPTISYDLTLRNRAYRTYVEGIITKNPQCLDRASIPEQFRLLIADPFVQGGIKPEANPWLIAIDALDGTEDDRTLLDLITGFILQHPSTPLLWVISSQLDAHHLLPPNLYITLLTAEIFSDIDQAHQDVETYLQEQFNAIRQIHHLKSEWPWPSYYEFLRVLVAASGSLAFATIAARFIDDPWISDPPLQVQRLISHLDADPSTGDSPLSGLDSLFLGILGRIPMDVYRRTTKMLLAARCFQHSEAMNDKLNTLAAICNILDITESDAYMGLQYLHPVLRVPAPEDAASQNLEFHHVSFRVFIQDPARSQDYCVVEDSIRACLKARLSVSWQEPEGNSIAQSSILTPASGHARAFRNIVFYHPSFEEFIQDLAQSQDRVVEGILPAWMKERLFVLSQLNDATGRPFTLMLVDERAIHLSAMKPAFVFSSKLENQQVIKVRDLIMSKVLNLHRMGSGEGSEDGFGQAKHYLPEAIVWLFQGNICQLPRFRARNMEAETSVRTLTRLTLPNALQLDLDHFYTQVMKKIPKVTLPNTLLLLFVHFHYIGSNDYLPPYCSILNFSPIIVHAAFKNLHPVLQVEEHPSGVPARLSFYHASFADFLRDATRSTSEFCVEARDTYNRFYSACVDALRRLEITGGGGSANISASWRSVKIGDAICSRALEHLFELAGSVDLGTDVLQRLSCINWCLIVKLCDSSWLYDPDDIETFIQKVPENWRPKIIRSFDTHLRETMSNIHQSRFKDSQGEHYVLGNGNNKALLVQGEWGGKDFGPCYRLEPYPD